MVGFDLFQFDGANVRVVMKDGEPWFVAADVCKVLGLVNVHRSVARIADASRGVHTVNTLGGSQQMTIVDEAALYKLIFKSRKPEAERFLDWVTGVVLPAIRKNGGYVQGQERLATGEMDEEFWARGEVHWGGRSLSCLTEIDNPDRNVVPSYSLLWGLLMSRLFTGMLVVVGCMASWQAQAGLMGPLPLSCGGWLHAKEVATGGFPNPAPRTQYINWLAGYLSGIEVAVRRPELETTDFPSVVAWMDNYCSANPLKSLAKAGGTLWVALLHRSQK